MSRLQDIRVRRMIRADASVLASAFASMDWHKPASLYAGYLAQHDNEERDVLVALVGTELAGYVKVSYCPSYPPLRSRGLPEIQDLNVLPEFRRQRVASRLMDQAEQAAALRANDGGGRRFAPRLSRGSAPLRASRIRAGCQRCHVQGQIHCGRRSHRCGRPSGSPLHEGCEGHALATISIARPVPRSPRSPTPRIGLKIRK